MVLRNGRSPLNPSVPADLINLQIMMKHFTEDQTFEKHSYAETPLAKGEYERCTFKGCDFSNSDLSEISFIDCSFFDCNLSLAKLSRTSFRDVIFKDCKMLGLLFYDCNDFGLSVQFNSCNLNHSSFFKRKIKNTRFVNTQLVEVDFSEADLTGALFDGCDLLNAKFENTILEKADLRTAFNYSINPEQNKLKKTQFSQAGIAGLLGKYDIVIVP
jgi:fluoroquinolone resistance protein